MKHGLKALAAAATLALSASYSHAALYSFNVDWTTAISGCTTITAAQASTGAVGCYVTASGAGTWDNATNVIAFTGTENLYVHLPVAPGAVDPGASNGVVTRNWTFDTDAFTFGYVTTSCTDDTNPDSICASGSQQVGAPLTVIGGAGIANPVVQLGSPNSAHNSGFVWDGVKRIRTLQTSSTRTFTFSNVTEVPQVPVPAAAWLFGSGLLGLAGAARKRR